MTPISEFVLRGTEARHERRYLIACILLVAAYVLTLLWLQYADIRIDRVFLARREAVRIAHALQHPVPLNETIRVSANGHLTPGVVLLSGWSVPEPKGVWSDASSAAMLVALPQSRPATLLIEVAAGIMLDGDGRQTIRAYGNGQLLGTWQLSGPAAVLRASLPAGVVEPSGALRLTFGIEHPWQTPNSPDPRRLGISVETLAVRDAALPR